MLNQMRIGAKIAIGFMMLTVLIAFIGMQTVIMENDTMEMGRTYADIQETLAKLSDSGRLIHDAITHGADMDAESGSDELRKQSIHGVRNMMEIINKGSLSENEIDFLSKQSEKIEHLQERYFEMLQEKTGIREIQRTELKELLNMISTMNQRLGEPDATMLFKAVIDDLMARGGDIGERKTSGLENAISSFSDHQTAYEKYSEQEKKVLVNQARNFWEIRQKLDAIESRFGKTRSELIKLSEIKLDYLNMTATKYREAHRMELVQIHQKHLRMMFVVVVTAVFMGIMITFAVARSIALPLSRIAEFAGYIADGHWDSEIQHRAGGEQTAWTGSRPPSQSHGVQKNEISAIVESLANVRDRVRRLAEKIRETSVSVKTGESAGTFQETGESGGWKECIQDLNLILRSVSSGSRSGIRAESPLTVSDSERSYLRRIADGVDELKDIGKKLSDKKSVW